ncbi:CopG family ribbon-helix-helix protein [Paracoccus yeei]
MASATSIKLDDEMKGRVQQLAQARQRTSHWIMREAISQ